MQIFIGFGVVHLQPGVGLLLTEAPVSIVDAGEGCHRCIINVNIETIILMDIPE